MLSNLRNSAQEYASLRLHERPSVGRKRADKSRDPGRTWRGEEPVLVCGAPEPHLQLQRQLQQPALRASDSPFVHPCRGSPTPWSRGQPTGFMPEGSLPFVNENPGCLCTGRHTGAYDYNAEEEWCDAPATALRRAGPSSAHDTHKHSPHVTLTLVRRFQSGI